MPIPRSAREDATWSTLRADLDWSAWLDRLDTVGPPSAPVDLPVGDDLDRAIDYLAIPIEYQPAVLSSRAWIESDPAMTWVLERSVELLRQFMGRMDEPEPFPSLPAAFGEQGRCFYPWVYAAVLPDTLAATRQRGIPEEVIRATFADAGRHFLIHRDQHGRVGISNQDWLMLHARGQIFQLGRLQFERGRLGGKTSAGIRAAGFDAEKGEPCVSVHIPGYMGPFPPEACDRSFDLAREFFGRHFPENTFRYAVCHSWLLDPQLAEYLPTTSNILAFQRRFRIAYTPEADDRNTLNFVFRTPDRPLDEFPQRTTLERAVVYHLRNGRHWHGGAGWLPFAGRSGKDNE